MFRRIGEYSSLELLYWGYWLLFFACACVLFVCLFVCLFLLAVVFRLSACLLASFLLCSFIMLSTNKGS